jgi:hypothetical protein
MMAAPLSLRDVRVSFEDYRYRTPIKFGGVALDRVTLLNVECDLEAANGRRATGFGSMPLGNVWAFPSKTLPYEATLGAMKRLAGDVAWLYRGCGEVVHPIETTMTLEEEVFTAAGRIPLAEPMPRLAALVVASPFDAALHDGFGKIHGLNCYRTYGPDFLPHDLGRWLGSDFAGLPLARFVRAEPQPTMPVYHLVGALDPLEKSDIVESVGDGLPETLGEWIERDSLTHLKIKLNGDDLAWDVERVLRVDHVAQFCPLPRKGGGDKKREADRKRGSIRSISTSAVRTSITCWRCSARSGTAGRRRLTAFNTLSSQPPAI